MPERVRGGGLGDSRPTNSFLHNSLQNSFVHVVSTLFSCNSIGEMAGSRKDPLPAPLLAGIRVLSFECIRKRHSAQAAIQVTLMLLLYNFKMFRQCFLHRRRKHGMAVFIAFTGTHENLIAGEIDIFDSQLQALHQSQARSVQ